ncbi:MAG TPA: peptide ABC transporter substrate-binding protein [Candidatus Eremiobacteraceae bacterium]
MTRFVGRFIVAAAAVFAMLFVASCSKTSTALGPQANGANPWTVHGTLRLTEAEEPNSLIRMFSNQESADDVTALLFEPFFRFDDHENPVPALVTVFPTQKNGLISADGKRITFKLRPGVVWSDGAPVTADDVIFTWHAIVDKNNPVVYTQGYDQIERIVKDSPHQVTFVLRTPLASAVYLFSEGTFMPLPEHLLDKYTSLSGIGYDADPVGDGPFVLQQWLHGSDLFFAANPRYWRGRPPIHTIDIKIIPNSSSLFQELKSHEVDMVDGVPKSLVPELATIPGVRQSNTLQANYRHLDFNCSRPILRDVAVRRAIARAIDVDKIIRTVYGGLGVRAVTDIPPFSWATNLLAPVPYDPAAADRILDDDGWHAGADGIRVKNGQRLSLTISTASSNLLNEDAEQLIAGDLKSVGIELTAKNYAGAVLFAPDGPIYGGRYDMAWIVNTEGTDPDNLGSWGCDYMPHHGANTLFYCNRKVDAYLKDAQVNYDHARRRADYEAAWKILLDDAPEIMIYWDYNVIGYNSDLKNFKPAPVITDYWNSWEWRI